METSTSILPEPPHVAPAAPRWRLPSLADLKALAELALPVSAVNLGLMFMGVVDTIMVGHVSAADLAGVALGNLYWFASGSFGFGALMALDPVVSQAVGAKDTVGVARGVQRGLILCVALSGAAAVALASVIARWAMLFGLLGLAWRELRPSLVPFRPEVLHLRPLVRMFRLGAPIGIQYVLEYGVFAVVALLMGRLGTAPMAAHQVAINIASLTFMVPLGISAAAAVLVGRAVGAGDPPAARRAAVAALVCGLSFMALSGIGLWLLARPLAAVYTTDAAVLAVASLLLPLAGVFQVFDGLQIVSIGVLRGTGDTRTPMLVNILGFWLVGLPVSLWFGFHLGGGPVGLWWGLVVGLAAVGICLGLRVCSRMAGPLKRLVLDDVSAIRQAESILEP